MGQDRRRVTFLFKQGGLQHCSGINSLLLSPDNKHLYTASRDSLIKRWYLNGHPSLDTDFEGHVDWVNDIALYNDLLLSCSSDKTVRVWDTLDKAGTCKACLQGHSDYVTALATSSSSQLVASAGLRGEVILWDLTALRAIAGFTGSQSLGGSIYSLAADESGTILAAGNTDGGIRLIDPRSPRCVGTLKGHTDNIRAVVLNPGADLLLSGSADHTMKLWDIRQHRCVHTMAVHTDSVWALAVDPQFKTVLSGGRDGCVYRTELASRVTELVLVEQAPVCALASTSSDMESVWVGTTQSTLRRWKVDPAEAPSASIPNSSQPFAPGSGQYKAFVATSMPGTRTRMIFENGTNRPDPQQVAADVVVKGTQPITQAAVMTNKRHILTRAADGKVLLWDVTTGAPVRDMGTADSLKEAEKELFDPAHNVLPWFSVDTRLGALAGVMDASTCFLSEAYRRDLGDAAAAADARVNMGEHMLRALFKTWVERRHGSPIKSGPEDMAVTPRNTTKQQESGSVVVPSANNHPHSSNNNNPINSGGTQSNPSPSSSSSPSNTPTAAGMASSYEFNLRGRGQGVIMISGDDHHPPFRCATDALTGLEEEGTIIPQWVTDCVLRGQYTAGKELKMAFVLIPAEGSNLPSLLQSRLNAPRVLGIDKVADYVLRKMSDQGVALKEEPLFWAQEKQIQWEAEHGGNVEGSRGNQTSSDAQEQQQEPSRGLLGIRQLRPMLLSSVSTSSSGQTQDQPLLITCNGVAVPWDFSLAAVRQWIWKKPDDLHLEYGIKAAGTQLKPPIIRAPVT